MKPVYISDRLRTILGLLLVFIAMLQVGYWYCV